MILEQRAVAARLLRVAAEQRDRARLPQPEVDAVLADPPWPDTHDEYPRAAVGRGGVVDALGADARRPDHHGSGDMARAGMAIPGQAWSVHREAGVDERIERLAGAHGPPGPGQHLQPPH